MPSIAHCRKIEIRTAGGAEYTVLADEGDISAAGLIPRISGFVPKMSSSAMVVNGYGADGVTVIDLGNRRWTLGFMVERQHADESAAAAYVAAHAAMLNDLGNVDLKITTTGGVTYLVNASITDFDPEPDSDQSSRIKYGFVSGNYTTQEP